MARGGGRVVHLACTLMPAAYSTMKSMPVPGEMLWERKQKSQRTHASLLHFLWCLLRTMAAEKLLLMGLLWPEMHFYGCGWQSQWGMETMCPIYWFFFFFLKNYLVGCTGSWLQHGGSVVAACRIFSCGMWGLVSWSGIKPGPCVLGAWSLSHWTTREVPCFHHNSYPGHLSPFPQNLQPFQGCLWP